jgi:hypothetical protein
MGGNTSTTKTTTIVNDILNKSVSTVMNKNVMMTQASISTDQEALNIVSSSVSGDIDFSGLKINQEANLTMDLDATLTSIDNTDISKDIAAQMLSNAKESMEEQDSLIPKGLFGESSSSDMKTDITNDVQNIIESNVTNDDVKECCSNLVSEQTAASIIVGDGGIKGNINASGLEINQLITAETVQTCVFDSDKTSKIVEAISSTVDNKLDSVKKQQNLIGSAGSAVAEAAQGVGNGVGSGAKGVGEGVGAAAEGLGSIFGLDTSTVIVIGVVAIAAIIGGIIIMKNKKGPMGGIRPPMGMRPPMGPPPMGPPPMGPPPMSAY